MDPRLATSLEGRYAIDREIGRGGMATVYLARDVRHNRNVALKVLNPELGAVLGVERFLSEIQVTANLQHPNLLPLFDSGEANGLLFYVMPYVEGESLRARLDREKQLPVDEAVRIAVSIANALDYAHGHGVIHRDLKPENILMQSGQPVIADFGIALAVSNAGGARVTQTGLSLGTPQYMSPEQATGDRAVDARADIYSLGAILYETLVGDPPHTASTAQAIIAKVLTEKPASVRLTRPNVSAAVEFAIGRALEKLAADRFATAKEFAEALEAKGAPATSGVYALAAVSAAGGRSRARELAAWTLVTALAAAFAWQSLRPRSVVEAPVVRVPFDPPAGMRIMENVPGTTIAVSPRGDLIAFTASGAGGFGLYVRRTNELVARRLTDGDIAARNLTFSPDGKFVAFTEGASLRKVSVDGGTPVRLSEQVGSTVPYGMVWTRSDSLIVGSFNGLYSIAATGGTVRAIPHPDSSATLLGQRWPVLTPDEQFVIYIPTNQTSGNAPLTAISLRTGKIVSLDIMAAAPLGFAAGRLVYVNNAGALLAVPFDQKTMRASGEPTPMAEDLVVDPTAGIKASLSPAGTLAYLTGRSEFQALLVTGGSGSAVPLLTELRQYATPRYSPDGKKVAVTVSGAQSADIWVYDLAGRTFTRVTTEGTNTRPEWTPDGKRLLFRSQRQDNPGIWWQPADGSGPAELLYQPESEPNEAIVSPDNQWLVFRTAAAGTSTRDILMVAMKGDRTVRPVVNGKASEMMPRISPDGKWLAYESNETGRFEVYVRPFPGPGARVQVSDAGGEEPVWSRSGRQLYYRQLNGELVEVAVTTGASFTLGARRVVVHGDWLKDASHANYDVAPDGRFLMLKRAGAEAKPIVVHNWVREVREKTGVGR